MKKIILMIAAVILLVSCGKAPVEKYNIAKECLDSLRVAGGMNSSGYYLLEAEFNDADSLIKIQESKLFKLYDQAEYLLDDVILSTRRFIMTYDRPTRTQVPVIKDINYVNTNAVKLEIEITFDSKQDPLKIASQVDDAVRRSMNLDAKLISVKIIE